VQSRFRERLIATAAMISNSLAAFDQLAKEPIEQEAAFRDLVTMATAALAAEDETA
jgi:hypothetical protein